MLKTLSEEAQASVVMPTPTPTIAEEQEEGESQVPLTTPTVKLTAPPPCSPRPPAAIFKPREQLMLRANSLKKAIRQIIEHTEKGINRHTQRTSCTHSLHTYLLSTFYSLPFSGGRTERSDGGSVQRSVSPGRGRGRGGRGGRSGVFEFLQHQITASQERYHTIHFIPYVLHQQ